jgi:tRNA nucleotidyltransferase/poly(A) polymerase
MMTSGALKIVKVLKEAGHTAYFAGGCVRDMLLNTSPKDYDVATSATPGEVQRLFDHTQAVGAHFGVVLVREGGEQVEVATFRNDGQYLDGRRPESVTFSNPREDAQRRDFTINGLFYDPVAEKVIDYIGGQEDLRAGVLRAIGAPRQRFEEDKLRLLRAVRFAARLGFEIEEGTWEAMKEMAPGLNAVSPERVREEFVKIITHPSRLLGFDLLDKSGLLYQIIPEFAALKGCEQPPEFHPEGDVFVHTRIMVDLLPKEPLPTPLVLSVLLHDIGKPPTRVVDENGRARFNTHEKIGATMTEDILRRLKFSNDDIEATVEAVLQHMAFKDVKKMRVARLKRFMARPHFQDELELHRVDCSSSHGALDNYDFLKAKAEEFANEPLIPPPLLTGHDLIKLGWKPGPHFKPVLEEAETLQLEKTLTTPEEALAWLKREYPAEPASE